METKKLIQEKLEIHKRQSIAYEMVNKAANHIYDAYRTLEMASQYCDNPEFNTRLGEVKDILGRTEETAGFINDETKTLISLLQSLMGDFKN
jgi:hypothetical protein